MCRVHRHRIARDTGYQLRFLQPPLLLLLLPLKFHKLTRMSLLRLLLGKLLLLMESRKRLLEVHERIVHPESVMGGRGCGIVRNGGGGRGCLAGISIIA